LVLAAAFGVPAETFDSFIVAPRMANLIHVHVTRPRQLPSIGVQGKRHEQTAKSP
jgi:hypothetical protein